LPILNVLNGTLDLRAGHLRPHQREDLITKLVQAGYDPAATCSRWEAFLDRIMAGNQNLIDFLRRAVGYSLTGSIREQVLFMMYGTGANGKSTFLELIRALLGDYAQQADFNTFLLRHYEGPRNDLARLMSARFVAATEAESGRPLAEVVVKQLTGGDTIAARFLRQEFFEYKPQFKLWLAANHKPVVRGTDNAIWRRIKLIPFTVTIPEPEQDRSLSSKLKEELSGILAWAVGGCLEWQEHGLGEPEEVRAATAAYRDDMDILAEFLSECCIVHPGAKVKASALYKAYTQWCQKCGEKEVKQRTFGMRLSERGVERQRTMHGYFYFGLGLVVETMNDNERMNDDEPVSGITLRKNASRGVIPQKGSESFIRSCPDGQNGENRQQATPELGEEQGEFEV